MGDLAMFKAIKIVFPDATHCLCSWHLNRNVVKNIKNNPKFRKEWIKFVHRPYPEKVFDEKWKQFVDDCGLTQNAWEEYEQELPNSFLKFRWSMNPKSLERIQEEKDMDEAQLIAFREIGHMKPNCKATVAPKNDAEKGESSNASQKESSTKNKKSLSHTEISEEDEEEDDEEDSEEDSEEDDVEDDDEDDAEDDAEDDDDDDDGDDELEHDHLMAKVSVSDRPSPGSSEKVQAVTAWVVSELAASYPKCQHLFACHGIIRSLVAHLAFETVEEHSRYAIASLNKANVVPSSNFDEDAVKNLEANAARALGLLAKGNLQSVVA
ncbi:hypothetical protein LINGRAHAP2_LOCUS10421 [Linum grandiflorum]